MIIGQKIIGTALCNVVSILTFNETGENFPRPIDLKHNL